MYSTNTVEGNARRCKQCGRAIAWSEGKQGRPPSYCSDECRRLWRREHPSPRAYPKGQVRRCVICGKEFTPRWKGHKCCSKACGRKSEAETKRKHRPVCKFCGKAYIPKKPDRLTYCSRECAHAAQKVRAAARAEAKEKARHEARQRTCAVCGKQFEGRPDAKYCSDECRRAKERQDYHERFVSARETNAYVTKTCAFCGKEFTGNFMMSRRRYCSRECAEKAYDAEHPEQRREQMRRRRARVRGAKVEAFSEEEIFERDHWVCQLCGKKVNRNLKHPHPMSATLDHIIPLALGGTHERKNVQLAHFICNVIKGCNTAGQQLRLFG